MKFADNNHKDNRSDYVGEGVSAMMELLITDREGGL